jgi:DNA modification methylase
MTKSAKYWYDAEAVKGEASTTPHGFGYSKDNLHRRREAIVGSHSKGTQCNPDNQDKDLGVVGKRNRRNSDWFFDSWQGLYSEDDEPLALVVNPMGFKEAHFATFPEKLVNPCILAGCPKGGIVLDPFMGSGTTGLVALKNNVSFLGIELNPTYIEMAYRRIITGYEKHLYGKPKSPKRVVDGVV